MTRSSAITSSLVVTLVATLFVAMSREARLAYGMTSHGTERKTIATVPLDDGIEAVVTLDHITGTLTGYVLDRFTGKFFIQYARNASQDFPRAQGKFLMAAGRADFRQITGNERFANGVIYVSEEASGQVVAYGIPWNSQLRANNAGPRRAKFIPLDFAKTRFAK